MANEDLEARHLETLDRDLGRFVKLETAASYVSRPLVAPGIALVFIMLAGLGAAMLLGHSSQMFIVVAAAVFGAYMALNIGANDVANNMGPAVGANALSMGGAIAIAAIFESAGALIAGADVVSTVATGIIAPDTLATPVMFIWAMMAALLASALWVNLATWIGAPVSTTHAVVGGVVGAGIVAAGFGAVNWSQMAAIAASWVISPVLGAIIAAGFLWLIKARIVYRADKIAAARVWVPILVGLMAGTFATYLIMKGLKQLVDVSIEVALAIGLAFGLASWLTLIPVIRRQSQGLENRNKSLKVLFSIPLVVSAALLSFAHGANDVANAVGPLA
ncbi:MAG: inorganic phosphate transporter, partial [Brucella intermedia]